MYRKAIFILLVFIFATTLIFGQDDVDIDPIRKQGNNGKWGFVDTTGKEIVPCIYDDAGYFNEGLANVKKEEQWGFIDKTGKVTVPAEAEKRVRKTR